MAAQIVEEWAPSRDAALGMLRDFTPKMGRAYTAERNFDFGRHKHHSVSRLAPYIRHRILHESELLDAALTAHGHSEAEKFAQEVVWRTYWKGWMEQRPSVWADYHRQLGSLVQDYGDGAKAARYRAAATGTTGIDCFDTWLHELIDTGYLHNHARMWFASIWIFTLELPWQLGADLFMQYLLDGDEAVNTLSWRWVAGLQTVGKAYQARPSNIEKYTLGRFNPVGELAETIEPIAGDPAPPPQAMPVSDELPHGDYTLLVTDDCLDPLAYLPDDRLPGRAILLHTVQQRSPAGVSPLVKGFVEDLLDDCVARLEERGVSAEIASRDDVRVDQPIVAVYAPVGAGKARLDAIAAAHAGDGVAMHRIIPEWDRLAWPHATKGFFAFKRIMPMLAVLQSQYSMKLSA